MTLIDKIRAADGAAIAAIDERGAILPYDDLRDRASRLAREIGVVPALVVLEGSSTIDWLVAYVACLLGRHPVIIVPAGEADAGSRIMTAFQPEVILTAADGFRPRRLRQTEAGGSLAPYHPDLAVMLSTSGSTGSAKCVRLSLANISANAASIAEYLSIGADERGVVSLPTHYSYGLSVVNSHLWAGATILLTARSVIEPEFWALCAQHGATSFAGVPYSYELLKRVDLARQAPPTLRYLTQAGGRLPADLATHFAGIARERGWRFYVMYGQTEATARMAYLPPDRVEAHPDCIGVAIPGGRFEITDALGRPVDEPMHPGELVYYGPNVMMGYATAPADLALGAKSNRLETGDLAQWTEQGLLQITGRTSRFIKVFGNRIGLDDVERLLEQAGLPAKATGVDEQLLLVTCDATASGAIADTVCAQLHLPRDKVAVCHLEDYPLLPSGKIDYAAMKALVPAARAPGGSPTGLPAAEGGEAVRAIFADLFGPIADEEAASFSTLGGDSLHYISTVLALEAVVPDLPDDWAELPLSRLVALADARDAARASARVALPRNLDAIRSLACILVVAMHVVGSDSHYGLRLPDGSLWHRFMDLIGLVRMPLFTAMAGFLYSVMPARRHGFVPFMRRKIDLLLWPMLFGTLFYWGLRGATTGQFDNLPDAFLGGYLHFWYIDAILAMFALSSLLDSTLRMTTAHWVGLLVLVVAVCLFVPLPGFVVSPLGLRLFPFFLLGILMHRLPVLWSGLTPRIIGGGIMVAYMLVLELVPAMLQGFPHYWGALLCGGAAVVYFVSAFPRVKLLEGIAFYTFTIYLWHPAANAVVREALQFTGLESVPVLFVIGIVAGVGLPIIMHKVIARMPLWVRMPLIGR